MLNFKCISTIFLYLQYYIKKYFYLLKYYAEIDCCYFLIKLKIFIQSVMRIVLIIMYYFSDICVFFFLISDEATPA